MSNPDQSRINYRISSELKKRLREHAEAQGRPINDVLDEFVRAHLDTSDQASNSEQDQLERDLEKVEKQLSQLEDGENFQRNTQIIPSLQQRYPELQEDFKKIRLQAVSDFRKGPASWKNELGIETERQVTQACQLARELHELKKRKADIETRLGAIYGIEVQRVEAPKAQATLKKKELENLPFYRVDLSKSRDGWCVFRDHVPKPPFEAVVFPFSFPDDYRGRVFEADWEEYPWGELVPSKRPPNGLEIAKGQFDWVDYTRREDPYYEQLSVTRMMQLDENTGRLLRTGLNEARKRYPYVVRREREQKTTPEENVRDPDRSDEKLGNKEDSD